MAALHLQPKLWGGIALAVCAGFLVPYRFAADAVEELRPSAPINPLTSQKEASASTMAAGHLPTPEPLVFEPVGAARARMLNAQIPMSVTPGTFAKPFLITGDAHSRERAIDCLASSMWYEAGNDARAQRAVGQVVLNRVRHPSFPASICGVVFQGAERRTGCQFTFTCDGALARRPSARELTGARVEARALLHGVVDREVGLATHYHTDWVHPLWSARMAKIAQVDTHLFFRWAGRAGEAATMTRTYAGAEPQIAELAAISDIHRLGAVKDAQLAEGAISAPMLVLPPPVQGALAGGAATVPPSSSDIFEMPVQIGGNGSAQAMAALGVCGDRAFCKVIGRQAEGEDSGQVAFLLVRDKRTGVERVLWDCEKFRRNNPAQCFSPANRAWIGFSGNLQTDGAAGRPNG